MGDAENGERSMTRQEAGKKREGNNTRSKGPDEREKG